MCRKAVNQSIVFCDVRRGGGDGWVLGQMFCEQLRPGRGYYHGIYKIVIAIIIIYYEKSYIIVQRTYKRNKITSATLISQMCAKWVPLTWANVINDVV